MNNWQPLLYRNAKSKFEFELGLLRGLRRRLQSIADGEEKERGRIVFIYDIMPRKWPTYFDFCPPPITPSPHPPPFLSLSFSLPSPHLEAVSRCLYECLLFKMMCNGCPISWDTHSRQARRRGNMTCHTFTLASKVHFYFEVLQF